eukprot:7666822-Karenia_brevis.AAC.1
MKAAFEGRYGKMAAEEVPSRAYLGLKQEDLEEDEPKAEKLSEVSSWMESQEDFLTTSVNEQGVVRIRKGTRDSTMPRNSEEL